MRALKTEINNAIRDGYITFITGMARGVDIWAAELVLDMRDAGVPIHLICAIPFPGFESRWGSPWRIRYERILRRAEIVRYIFGGYSIAVFQKRNEWMIDHSSRVIAVYNGCKGGTRNSIDYAREAGVEVIIIPDASEEQSTGFLPDAQT